MALRPRSRACERSDRYRLRVLCPGGGSGGCFPDLDEVPRLVVEHVRGLLELGEEVEPRHDSTRTAARQRDFVRERLGVVYDPEQAPRSRMDEVEKARLLGLLRVPAGARSRFDELKRPTKSPTISHLREHVKYLDGLELRCCAAGWGRSRRRPRRTWRTVRGLELLPQSLGVRALLADRQVRLDELPLRISHLNSRHARRSTGPGRATKAHPAD